MFRLARQERQPVLVATSYVRRGYAPQCTSHVPRTPTGRVQRTGETAAPTAGIYYY